MDQKMFCYQCEQTAGCAGCTGSTGVCGKTAETARLQDQLVGAMIGLSGRRRGMSGRSSVPHGDRGAFYDTYECKL